MRNMIIIALAAVFMFTAGGCESPTDGAPATYTVIFHANGGLDEDGYSREVVSVTTVSAGSSITLPNESEYNLSKAGHTFFGWGDRASDWGVCYPNGHEYTPTADITLYAQWEANLYTVTFNTNGGTPIPQQTIAGGSRLVGLMTFTSRSGYGFAGWYKEAALINQWDFGWDTVTGNITLYAKWDTNYYTVTFHPNGGTPEPEPQYIAEGGKVTEPPPVTSGASGYGFGGWFREEALSNGWDPASQWDFTADTVTGDITLWARWDTNYYTVTFSADGGTPEPAPQDIAHYGTVVEPPTMTKTGYTFGGWFKESSFTNKWIFAHQAVIENTTLYAKWTLNRYTVSFNADGGTPAPAQQNIDHGGKVTVPPLMSKTNYTFGGWFKESGLTDEWNFTNDTVTVDAVLYAKWTLNRYAVTFNANGGTPAPTTQTISHGGKVTAPSAMTRAGYTLDGWFKESGLTNQWNFTTDTVTAPITLYAKWIAVYTVTFNADGGTPAPAQQNIVSGGKVAAPPVMSKTNYTFGGWYKESGLTNQWDFATDTVTVNTALYAKWTLNQYAVTFNANGGTPAPSTQTISHGGKVTVPPAVTKTDYAFAGWFKEAAFINPWNFANDTVTGAITLYARWDAVMQTNRIEYYWVDQHGSLVTTSGGATAVISGATLTITAQSAGYVVKQWHLNGVNTGQSGITYNFSSTVLGKHTVGLFVEKDGKLYNTNITIMVRSTTRTVTIDMRSSDNGWAGGGTLRVVRNGVQTNSSLRVYSDSLMRLNNPPDQTSINKVNINIAIGDVVELYWVAGQVSTYQREFSFIVYYADTPPSPAFDYTNNFEWNGSNALLYRLRDRYNNGGSAYFTNVADGESLGSFTVTIQE